MTDSGVLLWVYSCNEHFLFERVSRLVQSRPSASDLCDGHDVVRLGKVQ